MTQLGRGQGVRVVDLGAFPGTGDATLVVTEQTGILPTALIAAWIVPIATTDHSVDEHRIEPPLVSAHSITADSGFSISLVSALRAQYGKWSVQFEWVNP